MSPRVLAVLSSSGPAWHWVMSSWPTTKLGSTGDGTGTYSEGCCKASHK